MVYKLVNQGLKLFNHFSSCALIGSMNYPSLETGNFSSCVEDVHVRQMSHTGIVLITQCVMSLCSARSNI